MEEKAVYQQVLETILKALVNNPDEVKIQKTIDELGVLLSIKVHPQDMGIVIGRKGATINSIKNIIKIIGNKHFARVNLKVVEPTNLEKTLSSSKTVSGEQIIKELKSDLEKE